MPDVSDPSLSGRVIRDPRVRGLTFIRGLPGTGAAHCCLFREIKTGRNYNVGLCARGCLMKEPVSRSRFFIRNFRNCMSSAWHETDTWYHIPKSRFKDGPSQGSEYPGPPGRRGRGTGKRGLRRFRDCLTSAWEASDNQYHIPKSRHKRAAETHS